MNTGVKVLSLVALIAVLALFERWNGISTRELQTDIRAAHTAHHALAAKATQDEVLRRRAAAALAAEESKVSALLGAIAARGQRKDGNAVDSVAETAVGGMSYANAANVGQGTPLMAFQTAIWATYHGNVEALAKMIALDPSAKDLADSVYVALPAASRASLQSADQMIALLIEYAYPSSGTYEVSWSGPRAGDPNEWLLGTKMVAESGQTTVGQLTFRQVDGNWMLSVPQSVVHQLAGMVAGVPEGSAPSETAK